MQVSQEIKFGTDGWRGIIGANFTFSNLKILSQAVADYLGGQKTVAVGFDTRFMSDKFAGIVAEILKNNGIDVLLSNQPIPTPALSFIVKSRKLDLGVMITASHNPAEYNGFKIKTPSGGAAGPELTKQVEGLLGKTLVKLNADNPGKLSVEDFIADYVKFIRSYIDFKKIKNKKFRVIVDAMHGSGNSFIARILKGTGIRLEFLRNSINPSFAGMRPEPLEENLAELKMRMKNERFDLG
jgi:phosphomannomutase